MASNAGSAVVKGADTATTFVCYYAAYKRLPRVVGLILLWLVVRRMTSGAEDRIDLQGEIIEVQDSVNFETQTIHTIKASRKVYPAVVVPGSQRENCKMVSRKVGETTVKTQVCTCEKSELRFIGEDGKEVVHSCPSTFGKCPYDSRDAYVTEQSGSLACSFSKPNVHCHINGSENSVAYPIKCPSKGTQIDMIRRKSDNKLFIPAGNWNIITMTIKYMDNKGIFRTQKIQKQMPTLSENTPYKVGKMIPVFYSEKHKSIYLEDWNGASNAGMATSLFGLLALGSLLEALSFLNYYSCRLRLGSKVMDAAEDKFGIDI